MRAFAIGGAVLALAACGSEVEPETVATLDNQVISNSVVDEEPVPEIGSAYTMLGECLYSAPLSGEPATSQARCEGHAGYDIIVRRGDFRTGLALVAPEDEEMVVDLGPVTEGRVNSLGRTIEWRGATPDDPRVMIVRVDVASDEDPMAADNSFLAVVRLEGPACVIARVPPGPGQVVVARRFADREMLPECLGVESEADAGA